MRIRDGISNPLRVVIVGGVAGGMSAATRLRRLDETAVITVVERSGHVSYANCGLPYFVGGVIEDEDDLLLQTPERLFDRFRLDVRVDTEVVEIDPAGHEVTTRSMTDGPNESIPYDKLVLSPGATPVRPAIPGFERVRVLRTVEDAERLAADVGDRPEYRRDHRGRVHRARDRREPRSQVDPGDGRRSGRPGPEPARPRDGDPRGG